MLKLNNKGFAISGILYSILILFLLLLVAILGILGSRKVVLDKTKNDVFNALNEETTESDPQNTLCISTNGTVLYDLGSVYSCDLGDGVARTFYVLEVSGDNVSLIMNQNLGNTVAWITQEEYEAAEGTRWGSNVDRNIFGPVTANNYLEEQTSNWKVKASLPTYDQIYNVNGSTDLTNVLWLRENIGGSSGFDGYWTSSSYNNYSDRAWGVDRTGSGFASNLVDNNSSYGIRPVITLNKTNLS